MIDLLVDPYMISARTCITQSEASNFIESVMRCMSAQRKTGCRLVLSNEYLAALWEDNSYPTPDKLREIYLISCSESFDVDMVFRAFDDLLNISPKIEDITGIAEILIDEDKAKVDPSDIAIRLPSHLINSLNYTLATCALYASMSGINYPFGFVTDALSIQSNLNVKGEFIVLAFDGSFQPNIALPVAVMLKLPVLTNSEDVLEILDFNSVCHDAECAISWSWVHAFPRQNRSAFIMLDFILREEFERSIVSLGIEISMLEQVYRKIAYLLSGLKSSGLQIEALRIDRGANSKQICRARDGAQAFRMQISQHGAGYHVHFWRCSGGLIEIASIGTHNDFSIPE